MARGCIKRNDFLLFYDLNRDFKPYVFTFSRISEFFFKSDSNVLEELSSDYRLVVTRKK